HDMVVRRRQDDVAHLRRAVVMKLAGAARAGAGHGDEVHADREPCEVLDRIGNRTQSEHHAPLVWQQQRCAPGAYRRRVWNDETGDWRAFAARRADDGRPLLKGPRDRMPPLKRGARRARRAVENLNRLYSALAVPDHHRTPPVALVVPGDQTRDL